AYVLTVPRASAQYALSVRLRRLVMNRRLPSIKTTFEVELGAGASQARRGCARVLMARRPLAAHGSKRVVSARRLWLPAQPEGEGRVPADRRCPRVRYQSVGRVIQGLIAPPDRPGSLWSRAPGAPSVLPVTWAASPSPSAESVRCFKRCNPSAPDANPSPWAWRRW